MKNTMKILIFLNLLTVAIVCNLIADSMIAYAPSVDKFKLQNIYIENIFWHGLLISILQIVSFIIIVLNYSKVRKNTRLPNI